MNMHSPAIEMLPVTALRPYIGNARTHSDSFGLGETGRYCTNVWDYAGISSIGATRMDELAMHPATGCRLRSDYNARRVEATSTRGRCSLRVRESGRQSPAPRVTRSSTGSAGRRPAEAGRDCGPYNR